LKTFLFALVSDGAPVFMVFGLVVYLLSITMTYNTNIMAGNVTPQYINFRNISAIFLVIEAIMLNTYLGEKRRIYLKEEVAEETGSLGNRVMNLLSNNIGIGLIILLFATLHILVVIIIDMNLRYFTTEGFNAKTHKANKAKNKEKISEEKEKSKAKKSKERKQKKIFN
jgi:hypothetical protein